jgi:hypothetical protein
MTQQRVEDVAVSNTSKLSFLMNPWEFWSQWNEMATRMWAHMENDKLENHSHLIGAVLPQAKHLRERCACRSLLASPV